MNKYTLKFTALCPNNKDVVDEYKISIYTKKLIEVEKIIKYLKKFKNKACYQEQLTKKISKHFNAKVILKGYHFNVKIKSIYDCSNK